MVNVFDCEINWEKKIQLMKRQKKMISQLSRFITRFAEQQVNKSEGEGAFLNKGEKPHKLL
jgi:hypothetical protein